MTVTHHRGVPAAGPHGGDGAAVAAALGLDPTAVLDLSASLNPFAPDPTPVLRRHLEAGAARRYPDDRPAAAALAARLGVAPDRLVLTNGGAEAIALVAGVVRRATVTEPEFSLYRRHLESAQEGARWRSNPHNPSGRLAGPGERAGVWDEAFYPLATGAWTRGDADAYVVGSLTKLLACPGLRVGYVVAPDPDAARAVAARRPAWSVNGLAAAALPELLDAADLPGWAAAVVAGRAELAGLLAAAGLAVWPSDANWLLADVPGPHGAAAWRDRLARAGVVVRDCASFGLPATVRVAVPDGAGLERLAAAIEAVAG